jgi:nucleoside-triphosphatase THEP1
VAVWLVTGEIHAGKTGFMEKLADLCRLREIQAGGFIVKGEFINNRRDRLRLINVATRESIEMATRSVRAGWNVFRGFYFNPEAFKFGKEILRISLTGGSRVVLLDEVGPLELEGGGWFDMMDEMVSARGTESIWAVRESIRQRVQETWGVPEKRVFSIITHSPEFMLKKILEAGE